MKKNHIAKAQEICLTAGAISAFLCTATIENKKALRSITATNLPM
jgi:hypothetical protein